MIKIMTIVGTRPELIKMSRVISEFDKYTNHILVHTGQNYDYELNEIFFKDLGIRKPDHFLQVSGNNAAETIARIIEKADVVMEQENPDAILLYGDTNSCLSVISAKRRKIPIFHMEAGNRCFDQRVPEELNRKIVDHLSDFNFVITEHARRYLISEGIRPETIIKSGSHMDEVLNHYMPRIKSSNILSDLQLHTNNYFLVSAHREENVDSPEGMKQLIESLNSLAEIYDCPVIFSTHPRTQKKINKMGGITLHKHIKFLKPFGFFDYIKLQLEAKCVLSDSGTITEESWLLGFTAINIRNAHERPEGMDEGIIIMTGLKKERVLDGVKTMLSQRQDGLAFNFTAMNDSTIPVSQQIVRAVMSYIDYINRTVWFKGL